jgi:hypothetical protein
VRATAQLVDSWLPEVAEFANKLFAFDSYNGCFWLRISTVDVICAQQPGLFGIPLE